MKLLCDNGTIRQLPDCAHEYKRRYNDDHGILVCVDARLLGGIRLELPDRQLDGSVQYHRAALSRKLRNTVL